MQAAKEQAAKEQAAKDEAAKELDVEEYGDETEDEDEDEDVDVVRKFEHDGKTYLKNNSHVLFDPTTQDPVGIWNTTTEMIDEYVEEDSDEEDNE